MRSPAFYPLSLVLIVIVASLTPVAPGLRALGGGLLLVLWLYGLASAKRGGRTAGYIPGHALLFLGLGLVGAKEALLAWFAVPPLSLALEVTLARGRRYLAALVYVILWLDLFACLHQLVAVGRGLTGTALWMWSAGVGVGGLSFVALGRWRILRLPEVGAAAGGDGSAARGKSEDKG